MEIDEYHSVIVQFKSPWRFSGIQIKINVQILKKTNKYCKYFVVVETEVN